MNQPRLPYTGEGFKGERVLAIAATLLTIASAALLIHLSLLQRKHTKMQINELEKKNGKS
jgi:hypothetical protein